MATIAEFAWRFFLFRLGGKEKSASAPIELLNMYSFGGDYLIKRWMLVRKDTANQAGKS
ncbi:hypothetical protein [Microbulbifer sp. GL-2]|uniref:hypothetical protein n=1 Tax=Microbulbifer sp. GL-2 TaxID=2591606 RepID=UPI00155AE845|nr:hypothetical protein [Microbulbifer sp. GL-2]